MRGDSTKTRAARGRVNVILDLVTERYGAVAKYDWLASVGATKMADLQKVRESAR
ncbi:MAG: hypothetical protein J2O49_03990 [Sciscionella sp.]|nr:hypothetical protein [Sciscionella sp.]